MTSAHEAEQEKGNKTSLLKEHNQLWNCKSQSNPKLGAADTIWLQTNENTDMVFPQLRFSKLQPAG